MNPDSANLNRFKTHLERINEELDRFLSSRITLLQEIGHHTRFVHGKSLRPLFFVLSCKLCNYPGENLYRLSTIFEYIHKASLLHDDVVDNTDVKRKKLSANHPLGNHTTVLEGDFLYSKVSSIAVDSKNLLFLKKITEMTAQIAESQVLELIHMDGWNIDNEQYMDIITSKTAVLVSAACAYGAIISGSEVEAEQSLEKFGLNVGVAFQLMDDLLVYTSSEKVIGKPVAKDLKKGKITLPLIYTLAKLEESERKRLADLFIYHRATKQDYRHLVRLVRSNGVIDQIQYEAQSYINKAKSCLSTFPDSSAKRDLLELAQYIIERKY